MKYHGFDLPLDWSQYLIQKADLHEYEPSEPGKRVEALQNKGRESPRFQPWDDRPTIMVFFVFANIIVM